jgi:hypothetical protein
MTGQRTDEKAAALAGLRELQKDVASLRKSLRVAETGLDRVCRRLEAGHPLHEVIDEIGLTEMRVDLRERLSTFEVARHRMRVACFRLSLTEGMSIAEIARLWGISRQLASRMINEREDSAG